MINLLPTTLRQQLVYSKRNAKLQQYVSLVIIVGLIAAVGFLGGRLYLDNQISRAKAAVEAKNADIAKYKNLEVGAKSVNDRLTAIQSIQNSQAKFSQLLADIAQATPHGVAITSIALTGDDKKPVRITASANSYKAAVSFRDSLAGSPRISAADLESVSGSSVTVTVAFKPGASK